MSYRVKVVNSRRYSPTIHELTCEGSFDFEPGNCVDIINPNTGVKKPYSIASSPDEALLRFYIRIFPSETGVSQYISERSKGDYIELGEPFGYFTPGKNEKNGSYIYIATGTGMSPFLSALDYYDHEPYAILYGVRTWEDILPFKQPRYMAISREPHETDMPKHVSGYFDKLPVDKPDDFTYYICGLEEMISNTTGYLIDRGVSWDKIQVEQFYYAR